MRFWSIAESAPVLDADSLWQWSRLKVFRLKDAVGAAASGWKRVNLVI
jgi:hypothetical protein